MWEDQSENGGYIHHIAPEMLLEYISGMKNIRCGKCIVNNETRWHIQVNSAIVSLPHAHLQDNGFM